ncbi:uncharacterized protein LOC131243574 isoform X2 [Magnolia sinica]|uniref:uncharacterized protein LOC131243574 isoform X2 n=1 Tax=Magnolia sinica TaxID=86752 RepID=UPI002657E1D7|nr:uncharacterized protein LOC131243574 isoform X2 [Magnolia sinica]
MDRFQQKKKSSVGEVNSQIKKRMRTSDMGLDSSLSSSANKENLSAFEVNQSSSKSVSGTSMKMLLADEMSKELEFKPRSPSVIARLMGLDAIPAQQDKQPKEIPKNYLRRTASVGSQGKSPSHKDRSFWIHNNEQQEFKKVLETLKLEMRKNWPVQKGIGFQNPSEPKMAFIRPKFMDAKCLSTDENIWQSKEFHDSFEVFSLESNKDLFLKFLQEPDSFFTKPLNDLQAIPTPQSRHRTVVKASKGTKYENTRMSGKLERKMEGHMQMQKDMIISPQEHGDCHDSHHKHTAYVSPNLSKSSFEGKTDTSPLPTRIVVLKPSRGKAQNTAKVISSPSSSTSSHLGYRKHGEFQRTDNRQLFPESRHRVKSVNNVELVRNRTKGSREIARKVTQKMRQCVTSNGSINVTTIGLKGYSGDESSYSKSGNGSASDSEALIRTPSHFYGLNNRYIHSPSYSTESSVSKEAKKHLSERWKRTHKFHDLGGQANRGSSTLGEMLALPDREIRLPILDSITGQDGSGDGSVGNKLLRVWDCPLGISSKDVCKNACPTNLRRSNSLPASNSVCRSPKRSIRQGALGRDGSFVLKEEAIDLGPGKPSKENIINQKESSSPRKIKFSSKKRRSFPRACIENKPTIPDIRVSSDELKNRLEESYEFEPKVMAPEPCVGDSDDAKQKDIVSAACDQNVLNLKEMSLEHPRVESHCHVRESDLSQSSKETGHHNPVSLFEVEAASSKCFEDISADLHGLRMQLQLLKLESVEETSLQASEIIILSDNDNGEGYTGLPGDKGEFSEMSRDEENRDFSFLLDMLIYSGFHGADHEMHFQTWYSPVFPLGPDVFEKLEEKYGKQEAWPRSERRLLFDRINSALVEIVRQVRDLLPWVKPKSRRMRFAWGGEALAGEVWQLLVRCEKGGRGDFPVPLVGWSELGDEVDRIGREIERLLMDELLGEFVPVLSSCGDM